MILATDVTKMPTITIASKHNPTTISSLIVKQTKVSPMHRQSNPHATHLISLSLGKCDIDLISFPNFD